MTSYYDEVKAYTNNFEFEITKQQYVKAIKTLRSGKDKKSYKWIYTALQLKPTSNWEEYGFGLMFNWGFQAQVENKMKILEEASTINVDDFWAEEDAANTETDELPTQEVPTAEEPADNLMDDAKASPKIIHGITYDGKKVHRTPQDNYWFIDGTNIKYMLNDAKEVK